MTSNPKVKHFSVILQYIFKAISLALISQHSFANPFTGGTTALKSDLLTIIAPFAGIALLAVGGMCLFGKISWWWLAGVIFGIVLVFGNDQIVSWVRTMFGV